MTLKLFRDGCSGDSRQRQCAPRFSFALPLSNASQKRRLVTLWLVSLLCVVQWLSVATVFADSQTRATMAEFYQSLRILLPLSVDEEQFTAASNRQAIRQSLATLRDGAHALKGHAGEGDVSTRYLSDRLTERIETAEARFERDDGRNARYLIRELTQVCVACHTKSTDPIDAPLSSAFVEEAALDDIDRLERAALFVATRQFDKALTLFETILADPSSSPETLFEAAVNYLVVSIRVKENFRRPAGHLASLLNREDLWPSFEDDIKAWLVALSAFSGTGMPAAELPVARDIISNARQTALIPYSLEPMVQYIVASQLLQQVVAKTTVSAEDLAEAYFLLGVTEYGIGYRHWLEQPENYLTNAIVVAPRSEHAALAYRLLEEQVIFGYTGSSGTHIPEDETRRLRRLRSLMEQP